jgi:hypothetical protein
MDMAFKLLPSMTPYFLDKYAQEGNNKNQILDPISTSIKMALYYYKPLYTKLRITNNRIEFQEPSFYQWFIRTMNHDEGSDIHIAICSIENMLAWYPIADPRIRYICKRVICGFEKMIECYGPDDKKVSKILTFFIDKIKREVGEMYTSQDDENDTDSIASYESDKMIEVKISPDDPKNVYVDYFQKHWNDREIMIIYTILRELEMDENAEKQKAMIKSVEDILKHKDSETYTFIKKLIKY